MINISKISTIKLENSNKKQLKKEASKWVAQAKKDSKIWNEMLNKQLKCKI